MKKTFVWFGLYLVMLIGLDSLVMRADSTMDAIAALNILTCAATFSYAFYFKDKILKKPAPMLSFYLLLLLFVLVCYPVAAYVLFR